MVDIKTLAVGAAAAVETLDPFAGAIDRGLLRRNYQQRVEALDRNHAVETGDRTQVLGEEHRLELLHQVLDVDRTQLEEADRHPGHPVDVEHVDRLDQVADLALGAGEDHQVAQLVAANRTLLFRERLQDPQHLFDPDELERHHDDAVAGRHLRRSADQLRRDRAADCGRRGHHLVDARFLHQRRVDAPQQHLEDRDQRIARDWLDRPERDVAADLRVDVIVLAEDVEENRLGDVADVGRLE